VFESPSVTDYVLLESMYRNLSAVTVAFWMKTSDKKNYGTPLSYATNTFDNALTVMDYNGQVPNSSNSYLFILYS